MLIASFSANDLSMINQHAAPTYVALKTTLNVGTIIIL